MLRLKTTRKALGLYGALLVLPTLVFGWLYWWELKKQYQEQLAAVPEAAEDGARRIVGVMRDRLTNLVEAEAARTFTDYGERIHPQETVGDEIQFQRSPLTRGRPPKGILAWFNFDRSAGPDGDIEIFVGEETLAREGVVERFRPIADDFRQHRGDTEHFLPVTEKSGEEPTTVSLKSVAVQLGQKRYADCLQDCSRYMEGRMVNATVSDFTLQFYVDDEDKPRAIASRRISYFGHLDDLPKEAKCLESLFKGFTLQQGFLIDVNWLFRDLPFEIAETVLVEDEQLRLPPQALPLDDVDTVFATIYPVQELGFETPSEGDGTFGRLEVEINSDQMRERFESQSRRFLGVALMLVLTLATGVTLLYRSVNRELEQAHRMQNFVAAVTHELRTPLSTIRLHGEMLLDGWASDPAKQKEYYRRIVRETRRLSTLVENVLEKSRLKENVTEPQVGELNDFIEAMRAELEESEVADLSFDLAPNLPPVWLTPDGVVGIVSNLIENARKYAPVAPGDEPILIRTRYDGEHVLLQVADRGPGVPSDERDKIFEAFYRMGSEATRTATGTGLGLHLVRIHAQAAEANVSVRGRRGGGSVFEIAYRAAV